VQDNLTKAAHKVPQCNAESKTYCRTTIYTANPYVVVIGLVSQSGFFEAGSTPSSFVLHGLNTLHKQIETSAA
jgi:hypothetical protein